MNLCVMRLLVINRPTTQHQAIQQTQLSNVATRNIRPLRYSHLLTGMNHPNNCKGRFPPGFQWETDVLFRSFDFYPTHSPYVFQHEQNVSNSIYDEALPYSRHGSGHRYLHSYSVLGRHFQAGGTGKIRGGTEKKEKEEKETRNSATGEIGRNTQNDHSSSNFMWLQAISSVSLRTTDHPLKRRGPGHVIYFKILHPLKFLWNG